MTLRLTPEILESAYELLRQTQPFKGWKLPPADEVEFHVIRDPNIFADCEMGAGDVPIIRVSERKNGHLSTLLATVAHEICHVRQFQQGDSGNHNAMFWKLARRVCAVHGWDIKSF